MALADPNPCLGAGFDTTMMSSSCLANIYNPTDDTTFTIDLDESQLIEFSVVMTSGFKVDAYFHEKTESSDFFGFGSSSKEVYRFYKNYYTENKSLTKIILTIAYVKQISPAIPFPDLNPMFEKELQMLPPYKPSSVAYDEFIMSWGTTVIDEVTLGGSFESSLFYDIYFNLIYSEEKVDESSHWSFFDIIGDGHGSSSHTKFVDKEFNATVQSEYTYVGGNIKMRANQYLDWASTVKDTQQIIFYHLVPITFFIQNATISGWVSQAITDYNKSSLGKLSAYISSLKN